MSTAYRSILSAFVILGTLLPLQNAAAWGRFDGGHHPDYDRHWAHADPVVVHRTYVTREVGGCVGCGIGAVAVAGLVGGAIVGAAIASSAPVVVEAPPPVVIQGPPIGTEVAGLPPNCAAMNVNTVQYYQCGPIWYRPYFGSNGVYYSVVPTP